MTTPNESKSHSMTRRGFLQRSAGAGAAVMLAQAGAAQSTQANSKIELGIIGCGGRGKWIAQGFMEHGGYQITALADYFLDETAPVARQFGIPQSRCFSGLNGYRRLLESGVDAVALETPPYFFPDHVEAAVEAGCHVFLAKPVAVDVPGTIRVRDMGRKAGEDGLCFLVDFQMRNHPIIVEAVDRVHNGALRHVTMLSSQYSDEGFNDPPLEETIENRLRGLIWVNDTVLGGGFFVNAGIHAVDAALWVADRMPEQAMGRAARRRRDPHGDSNDTYSLTYTFADGMVLNHWGAHIRNTTGLVCRVEALGQGAFLETNYTGVTTIRGDEESRLEGGDSGDQYRDGAWRNIEAFHEAVTAGDTSNPTLEPSINSNFAVLLGRMAALREEPITWDQMMNDTEVLEANLSGLTM